MPGTLFISDLHLDAQRPDIVRLFLHFLDARGHAAESIYILGDLFEVWLGDDDCSPIINDAIGGLRACADAGTCVYLMHGNRDFLIGEQFAAQAGARLLPDPACIDLYGEPVLLMHGDLLCTDDTDYMAFREKVRSPCWREAFLARPLEERRGIAGDMRRESRVSTRLKTDSILDVNPLEVTRIMTQHRVRRLIHGHTHRPCVHELQIGGEPAQRLVLGDWYEHGSVLECTPSGCQLQQLTPEPAPGA